MTLLLAQNGSVVVSEAGKTCPAGGLAEQFSDIVACFEIQTPLST
jgi:hypothetical protein